MTWNLLGPIKWNQRSHMFRFLYITQLSYKWMSHNSRASSINMPWMFMHVCMHKPYMFTCYGVASVSRIDKFIGLFCKRALWNRRHSSKETYDLIHPTNLNHPIVIAAFLGHSYIHVRFTIGWLQSLFMYIPWIFICKDILDTVAFLESHSC